LWFSETNTKTKDLEPKLSNSPPAPTFPTKETTKNEKVERQR